MITKHVSVQAIDGMSMTSVTDLESMLRKRHGSSRVQCSGGMLKSKSICLLGSGTVTADPSPSRIRHRP